MESIDFEKLSRFLAKVLRHDPALLKIWIDDQGWADIDKIFERLILIPEFKSVSKDDINSLEKRFSDIFEIENNGIRCLSGHSLKYVRVGFKESQPPIFLFSVCNSNEKDIVLSRGLGPTGKNKFVGLFTDGETMMNVIKKAHGKTFFKIYAGDMMEDGKRFYVRNNKKGIFYTETVHPKFIKEVSTVA